MTEKLQQLIKEHGREEVLAAVTEIIGKPVPRISSPLVSDESLQATLYQLDTAVSDILKAGDSKEATYKEKAELLTIARKLETEIQLVEVDAIMEVVGTGKDAYGIVTGADGKEKKVALTNDLQRDAYRRKFSAPYRKELAEVEANIRALEVAQAKATDQYNAKKEALDCIKAKAYLQANLLAFLK